MHVRRLSDWKKTSVPFLVIIDTITKVSESFFFHILVKNLKTLP